MNQDNQKSKSVKISDIKTDKTNPSKPLQPTKNKQEQISQLPKKPAIHSTIHHFTKFIESGFGTFSDTNWRKNSPVTSEAFQTTFLGVKLHNKIQLENTLKMLYKNANPVSSLLYLVLLNEFININNQTPKFIDKNGNVVFSELIENQRNEGNEKFMDKININKSIVYVDENAKEEQKRMNETKLKYVYCDRNCQMMMIEMNKCCLHLESSLKNHLNTIEDDFDCLLKIHLIDSVDFFPMIYNPSQLSSPQCVILSNIVDYIVSHYSCDCECKKEYLKIVILKLIKRPIVFSYFSETQLKDFLHLFMNVCKCQVNQKESLELNYPNYCPSSNELRTHLFSSLLPQLQIFQNAILELYNNLSEKEKNLRPMYDVLLKSFPNQNYEMCCKLMKNSFNSQLFCDFVYKSLIHLDELPEMRKFKSDVLNMARNIHSLYIIRGINPQYKEILNSQQKIYDIKSQLRVFEDQMKLKYKKTLYLPLIPDELDDESLLIYSRIILFVIDNSNSDNSVAVRYRTFKFNLKPFARHIKTLFASVSDTLLSSQGIENEIYQTNSDQNEKNQQTQQLMKEIHENISYLYYQLFYADDSYESRRKTLLMMYSLTVKYERCSSIFNYKHCHSEFISLCLQRKIKTPSFYLTTIITKWHNGKSEITCNPSYQSFLQTVTYPLDKETIELYSKLVIFEHKQKTLMISSLLFSLPQIQSDPTPIDICSVLKSKTIPILFQSSTIDESYYLSVCTFMNSLYCNKLFPPPPTSLPMMLAHCMPYSIPCAFAFYEIVLSCLHPQCQSELLEASVILLDKDIINEEVTAIIKSGCFCLFSRMKTNNIDIVLNKLNRTRKMILKSLFDEFNLMNMTKKK